MGFRFCRPRYEVVLWTAHVVVTILAIVDRFVTNVWPRQSFTIGAGSAGNDRMNGFKEGPWSVVLYDILARFSGRFSIVCFNFMLITRLRIPEQLIASSWIGNHVLDCSNITKSNLQAHKWNGIALCILTLIHVWSILFPCITHRWKAQVVPGVFEWPLSERTPPGFKDADPTTQTMSLQVDDVFRLLEMTLLLGVLTPLSIRWMARRWHLGIHVHRFMTVIYFVDIVRRHSHPHSWVFNTPIFVLWIVDKLVCLVWRRVKSPNVIRQTISNDYIALYWTVDKAFEFNEIPAVGSNFLMKMKPSSWLESPHPFTAFKNRFGSCNFLLDHDEEDTQCYTHAAVVRTYHTDRKPRIGGERRSHTERMAESSTSSLSIWGAFQGHTTNLIPRAFFVAKERNIVLAGSGSAVNFMIDILSQLSGATSHEVFDLGHEKQKQVILLYSTRDIALYEWVVEAVRNLLSLVDAKFKNTKIEKPALRILMACTANSKSVSVVLDRTFELEEDFSLHDYPCQSKGCTRDDAASPDCEDLEATVMQYSSSVIELHSKRLEYRREIPDGSHVFCQGSTEFKNVIASCCRGKIGVRLYSE